MFSLPTCLFSKIHTYLIFSTIWNIPDHEITTQVAASKLRDKGFNVTLIVVIVVCAVLVLGVLVVIFFVYRHCSKKNAGQSYSKRIIVMQPVSLFSSNITLEQCNWFIVAFHRKCIFTCFATVRNTNKWENLSQTEVYRHWIISVFFLQSENRLKLNFLKFKKKKKIVI